MENLDLDKEQEEITELEKQLVATEMVVKQEQKAHTVACVHVTHCQEAQDILQRISQAVQQQAHNRISEVVTKCLQSVFPDNPYEFQIIFERKRGKTEARLAFVRDGIEFDPLSSSGGGVVDVAAFALRVACLVLHRPRLSRVVVLDEPFKFVSEAYRENVKKMLEELSTDLDLQIIMVTHIDELVTGKVIHLR